METAWAVFRFVAAFAAVLVVARLLTGWLGRQYGGGGRNLEVIESVGVGPRRLVCLLRAGDQYLVLGITDGSITTLQRLDRIEEREPLEVASWPRWPWNRGGRDG